MKQTPNYNLPQLEADDKFYKEILNEAYEKIDTAISDLQDTINIAGGGSAGVAKDLIEVKKNVENLKNKTTELDNDVDSLENNLSEVKQNSRKLKFKLCVSPWWRYSKTQDIFDRDIERFKKMGVDGFALCFHISNTGTVLNYDQDLPLHDYAIGKLKEEGLSISCIKVHCTQTVFDSTPTSFDQFKVLVKSLCDRYQNQGIPYFTFLNEVPGVYNGSDSKFTALISELSTYIRSKGFLTGFSYANDLEITETIEKYPERIECVDIICRNTYPIFGYKDKSTNYDDSLYAWQNKDSIVKKCKTLYPDKKFILSECGIQQWYECFRNPALPLTSGTLSRGETGKIFYYGLFENKTLNGLLDEVWMWFPEQQVYDTFFDFIKSYTGNI